MENPKTAPHVVIAIPCYTWNVRVQTMHAICGEIVAMAQRGWSVELSEAIGDALAGRVRNTMAADFLKKETGTHLVFIDDDVAWPPGSVIRLVEADQDIVGGVYRTRHDPENYVVTPETGDNGKLICNPETGLMQMRTLMGGFTCFKRSALERMRDNSAKYVNQQGETCWDMFESGVYAGEYWGEDTGFFRKWADLGGTAWCIPDMELAHIGPKVFTGNYAAWMVSEGVKSGVLTAEQVQEAAQGAPLSEAAE